MAENTCEFHFVFGLRVQNEPFHILHYLCLESCRQVNRPHKIHLHLRHRPHGLWWDRIAPHLQIHIIDDMPAAFDTAKYVDSAEGRYIAAANLSYAHEADFLRLQILLKHGGVYADMDTLFVQPYPERFYGHEFLIGEEASIPDRNGILRPSLCNAVLFAKPHAHFAQEWLRRMGEVFDGTWNRHSCDEAARVWSDIPQSVTIAPTAAFYPFAATPMGIAALFVENSTLPRGTCSMHLWAHLWWQEQRIDFTLFHAGLLTANYVRTADTTYAKLARRFLDDRFDDAR